MDNLAIPIIYDPALRAQLTSQETGQETKGAAAEPETPALPKETVPWLEGALLRHLTGDAVLDIKAPGDPDTGPILPGALAVELGTEQENLPAAYSAIFSRDALMFVADPLATMAHWFGMLRELGTMIIVLPYAGPIPSRHLTTGLFCPAAPQAAAQRAAVPHADALLTPPLRGDTNLGVTEEGMIWAVRAALPPGSFDIIELGTGSARRANMPEGALDIRLALRKRASVPASAPVLSAGAARASLSADALIPFMRLTASAAKTPGLREEGGLLIRDFAPCAAGVKRILVLKLDHHGDFIIGLPALRELRHRFPGAYIRLICGRWNVAAATTSGLVDDVRPFDYFPERAAEWTGVTRTPWSVFAQAVEGYFDLAIDLRVDDDTRALLGRVDAGLRCGIGSQARFPMLDIALPDASRQPIRLPHSPLAPVEFGRDGAQLLKPGAFYSDMEIRHDDYHETRFKFAEHLMLSSGELYLPKGHYGVAFELESKGFVPGIRGAGIRLEVSQNGTETLAAAEFGRGSMWRLSERTATLRFESIGEPMFYEFRLRTLGRPLLGRLKFFGVRLMRLDSDGARYSPSELHIGEKLSLLVSLIAQRTQFGVERAPPAAPQAGPLKIVIAPFSNSTIRDWGAGQYAELINLLASRLDCAIEIIGAPAQVRQAAALMALVPAERMASQVTDRVGKTQWAEMPGILREADLVICNNSGIAHQAAQLGVRTLAIYSASHQPTEWGPRGPASRAIMMGVACSPCGFERVEDCRHDHLCMKLITPEAVMAQVTQMLANAVP